MLKYEYSCGVLLVLLFLISGPLFVQAARGEEHHDDVRPSVLAGTWYPADPEILAATIRRLLETAPPMRVEGVLKAIIVPHAGYRYSGAVAAHAYKLLLGKPFKQIILLGPSHRTAFNGVSVNLQSGYQTPLGIAPVNRALARKLLERGPPLRSLRAAHRKEHSLEIQLPFLQTVLADFQIVPIIMGQQGYKTCVDLANALIHVLAGRERTLILASSDLSHYHPYRQARDIDLQFIKRVQNFDPQGLAGDLAQGKCEACGGGPVITAMLVAKGLGATRPVILSHANSGDVTGDLHRVVGYLAAALFR